jgi:hypothetical protein
MLCCTPFGEGGRQYRTLCYKSPSRVSPSPRLLLRLGSLLPVSSSQTRHVVTHRLSRSVVSPTVLGLYMSFRREPTGAKQVPGLTKDGEIATFVLPDLSIKDLLSVIP